MMTITVLIENTSENDELICEHGLCLVIAYGGRRIILDAGSSDAFYENAKQLGVPFENIDAYVLSHGHYDHSGGYKTLFENNDAVRVYAQRSALGTYYSSNGGMHEIGIPNEVKAYSERFILTDGVKEILPDIYLIPHSTVGLDEVGQRAGLYKKVGGDIVYDDFAHEQSVVFDTPKGLVIFNSCSHGGVRNIIAEAKNVFNGKKVYAYIGGLHTKGSRDGEEICIFSDEETDELCKNITDEGISFVCTGHCTGQIGMGMLRERLGKCLIPLTTGLVLEL